MTTREILKGVLARNKKRVRKLERILEPGYEWPIDIGEVSEDTADLQTRSPESLTLELENLKETQATLEELISPHSEGG